MPWFAWFAVAFLGVRLVGRWEMWRRLDPCLYRYGAVSVLVLNRTGFWKLHRSMRADFAVRIHGDHVRTHCRVTALELREAVCTIRHLSQWVS